MEDHMLYCVKTDPIYGRGLYATEDIEAERDVLKEAPLVYCLEIGSSNCFSCLAQSSSLKKCLQCGSVTYCGKDCQAKDWPQHRLECRGLAGMDALTKANSTRMRLLVKAMYTEGVQGKMATFVANGSQYPDIYQVIQRDLRGAMDIAGRCRPALCALDQEMGHDLLCKFMCNSFMIFTLPYKRIGEAIYAQCTLLNHSCEPNCYYMFKGTTLVITTLKKVKAGDQLFICYVNPLNPLEHNPHYIKHFYGFETHCVHCDDIGLEDFSQLKQLNQLYDAKDWQGVIRHFKEPYKYKNTVALMRATQLYYIALCEANEALGLPISTKAIRGVLARYEKLRSTQRQLPPWDVWLAIQEHYE